MYVYDYVRLHVCSVPVDLLSLECCWFYQRITDCRSLFGRPCHLLENKAVLWAIFDMIEASFLGKTKHATVLSISWATQKVLQKIHCSLIHKSMRAETYIK